jgi:hypothetical protein
VVRRGGHFDRWDLEVRNGVFGASRILMAIEDHGSGRQLVRYRSWPSCSPAELAPTLLFATLSAEAALDHSWLVCILLGVTALMLALRTLQGCAAAMAAVRDALLLSCIRIDSKDPIESSERSHLMKATQCQTTKD